MQYISIQDAALQSGKSIQTIRRMVRANKVSARKERTPQGFVYLIDAQSLEQFARSHGNAARLHTGIHARVSAYQAPGQANVTDRAHVADQTEVNPRAAQQQSEVAKAEENKFIGEIEKFNTTVQRLIEQNERDKENFFKLIQTFQERVQLLEEQIKMLEAPKKKWWQLWKSS